MLTMGAALRVVTDWVGDPAAVRLLLRPVHQAGRGARRRSRRRGDLHRHGDGGRGLAGHVRPSRRSAPTRRCSARHGRKSILTLETELESGVRRPGSRRTRRCGSAARRRRLITADTEADLVAAGARRRPDRRPAVEPARVLGGGSNVLIGDDGVDRTRGPGGHPRRRRRRVRLLRGGGHRRGRGELGRSGGSGGRGGVGRRHRGPGRHPRSGRGHPDPERRRVRLGGEPAHRLGPDLGPGRGSAGHLRRGRLRFRLPDARASRPSRTAT